MANKLAFEKENNGKSLFLTLNGERIGAAWTDASGGSNFALHMNKGYGPFYSGPAECLKGAATDLVAAYWKWSGDDAAFPA
jgi:hypothetical protein